MLQSYARVNLLVIAEKRGVALISIVSIHPYKCSSNTREQNGCHTPLLNNNSITSKLTCACECDAAFELYCKWLINHWNKLHETKNIQFQLSIKFHNSTSTRYRTLNLWFGKEHTAYKSAHVQQFVSMWAHELTTIKVVKQEVLYSSNVTLHLPKTFAWYNAIDKH